MTAHDSATATATNGAPSAHAASPPPAAPEPRKAPPPPHRRSVVNLLISLVLGLVILAGAGYLIWYIYANYIATNPNESKAKQPTRPVPVLAVKAKRDNFDIYLSSLGTVTAYNTVTVRTRVDGQLLKVYFKEGAYVTAGDPLVDIDAEPYRVQRQQAEGNKARNEVMLASSRRDLKRYQDAGPDAVPQQTIDQTQSQVDNLVAALKVDDANINGAQVMIDYCKIAAPISGRVGFRITDLGNQVKASDPNGLLVITQLQPIVVAFTVPQSSIPAVQAAAKKNPKLPIEAFTQDNKTLIATGELLAMDNQIDVSTGTVKIKASFKNADDALFPNQMVNVRLKVSTLNDVVTVDTSAIQRGPKGAFVFVAKKDEAAATQPAITPVSASGPTSTAASRPAGPPPELYTVEMRPVEVSRENDTVTVVTTGLLPDEIVVTRGVDRLVDGNKVTLSMDDGRPKAGTQPATTPSTRKASSRPDKDPV